MPRAALTLRAIRAAFGACRMALVEVGLSCASLFIIGTSVGSGAEDGGAADIGAGWVG